MNLNGVCYAYDSRSMAHHPDHSPRRDPSGPAFQGPVLTSGSSVEFDEEAFARDWVLGQTLKVLCALYGWKNINQPSRHAKRLGLPPRGGGPKEVAAPAVLSEKAGRWVPDSKGIQKWVWD